MPGARSAAGSWREEERRAKLARARAGAAARDDGAQRFASTWRGRVLPVRIMHARVRVDTKGVPRTRLWSLPVMLPMDVGNNNNKL